MVSVKGKLKVFDDSVRQEADVFDNIIYDFYEYLS